jgi:integrase
MNPFRGARARPKRQTSAPLVPTDEDIESLLTESKGSLHAAILCMVEHGFRIGALSTLEILGLWYKAYSNGKQLECKLSTQTIEAI